MEHKYLTDPNTQSKNLLREISVQNFIGTNKDCLQVLKVKHKNSFLEIIANWKILTPLIVAVAPWCHRRENGPLRSCKHKYTHRGVTQSFNSFMQSFQPSFASGISIGMDKELCMHASCHIFDSCWVFSVRRAFVSLIISFEVNSLYVLLFHSYFFSSTRQV